MNETTTPTDNLPDRPVTLKWAQEVAASWSLLWPSDLAAFVLLDWFILDYAGAAIASLVAPCLTLIFQGVLSFRLVRKNYKTFYIGIAREGSSPRRHLNAKEWLRLGGWIASIQATLMLLALGLVTFTYRGPEIPKEVNGLMMFVQVFGLGPLSLRLAMRAFSRTTPLRAYAKSRNTRWSSLRYLDQE